MTTIAIDLPRRQLTAADYLALPEWPDQHWELLEGNLVMAAYATAPHNHAVMELASASNRRGRPTFSPFTRSRSTYSSSRTPIPER